MIDQKTKSEIIHLIKKGFTRPEISKKLNLKVGSIKHIAETNGLVTHKKMTIEEKQRVNVMFNEGIPVSEIALIIGKSVSSINSFLDRSKKTSYKCEEIVRLHKLKIGNKSIAHLTGVSESNVRMTLRRKGFAKKRTTDDQVEKILQMAKDGLRTVDISEITNVPITTVQAYLRRNGIARPKGAPNKPRSKSFKWDLKRQS